LLLANDTVFGLSAMVFTASDDDARRFAQQLECSGVSVAFGGVKQSGFGRELSHFGLHEFCNIQTVWKDRY